eukprot:TRINITY_DN58067_c0_g1_i1.p1 TRINITY_DN58067_c0_g1~~TRINITY_DN58067_c0_g1_i1.p1  ORF type:complete len:483 (-),score=43.24 TRINITY_DN58067_c0_g1_i1:39-1487(-)
MRMQVPQATEQHSVPSTSDDNAAAPTLEQNVAPSDCDDSAALSVTEQPASPTATNAIEQHASQSDPNRNASYALCVFFDLETTGLNIRQADVIEVAAIARLMLPGGSWHQRDQPSHKFSMLVRTSKTIPRAITRLTGITNDDVEKHGVTFHIAMLAWQSWIRQELHSASEAFAVASQDDAYGNGEAVPLELWLVGHNILNYDIPVLASQDARRRRQEVQDSCSLVCEPCLFEGLCSFIGVADTLRMARSVTRTNKGDWGRVPAPTSHKLGCLHSYILGKALEGAHTALGDAIGVAELCARKPLQQALHTAILGAHANKRDVKSRYAPAGLPLPNALLHSRHLRADIVSTGVQPRQFPKRERGSRRNARKSTASCLRKVVSRTVQNGELVACGNGETTRRRETPAEDLDMQPVAKKACTTMGKPARRRWRHGVLQPSAGDLKASSSKEPKGSNKLVFKSLRTDCSQFCSCENRTSNIIIDISS